MNTGLRRAWCRLTFHSSVDVAASGDAGSGCIPGRSRARRIPRAPAGPSTAPGAGPCEPQPTRTGGIPMSRFTSKIPRFLPAVLAAVALLAALGIGACSRSGVDSLTAPTHDGATAFAKGPGQGGAPPPPPPAPPPAADPCVSIAGFGGAVVGGAGSVPQNRAARLRIEIAGDLASGTLAKIAGCSAGLAPTVTFVSGTASASSGGGLGVASTFGAFAPGVGEAGVLLATDAGGNVLEIIWPA